MNAVVSLCHFCELHGPSVLISTQPCRSHNPDSSKGKKFYGPPESLQSSGFAHTSLCEACHSLSNNIFVSSDHSTQTSYVSSQFPWQTETEGLVRQACTRSLSCEVSPGKEGVLVYSDELGSGISSGCSVLSYTFLIRDSLARGFHRWFSITVLTRDRLMLLNMWPFLEKNVSTFVSELQVAANRVYSAEQIARPQRSLRLSNAYCADRSSRSLQELTGLPQVFPQLHLWFVWLLQNAATLFRETLPVVELAVPLEPLEEEEVGYTFISAKSDSNPNGNVCETNTIQPLCIFQTTGPSISSLGMLRSILGPVNFTSIVFCLLVGRQIIVRGQPAALIASILFSLKILLPRECVQLVPFSSQYIPPQQCNMLGLEARAAVPQPSPQVARLEVLPPAGCEAAESQHSVTDGSQFSYHLKWAGQLPAKWPTFLSKLDRAMQSGLLNDSTLKLQIRAMKMEALNAARVLCQLDVQDKKDIFDRRDKTSLLQALGVGPLDVELLSFWSKCCLNT